jgi:spermidine synthase
MSANFSPVHEAHITMLRSLPMDIDGEGLKLGGTYVMFFAEAELMSLHADALLTGTDRADVLEVGLGLGVFAQQAAAHRPATYTAIEPHPQVALSTQHRALDQLGALVTVHLQPWQLVPLPPESFDAIMYDTWPPAGLADADFDAFVRHALPALKPGGRFSFFWSGSRLSPRRAQSLDQHFAAWQESRYVMPKDRTPVGWTKPTREFVIPVATK